MDAETLLNIACAAWMDTFLAKAKKVAQAGGTRVSGEDLNNTSDKITYYSSLSKKLVQQLEEKGFIIKVGQHDVIEYITFSTAGAEK